MQETKRNKLFSYVSVFAVALIIILAVISVGLLIQKAQIDKEKAELQETIQELRVLIKSEEDKIKYKDTIEWVEKTARALGMISENETVWKLIENG